MSEFIGSLPQLLAVIEGAAGGSLPVILAQLENSGFSARVQSWLGHGTSMPVTAEELETVFTPEQLNAWAEHAGTTPESVLQAMAVHLPDVASKGQSDADPDQSMMLKDLDNLQDR